MISGEGGGGGVIAKIELNSVKRGGGGVQSQILKKNRSKYLFLKK